MHGERHNTRHDFSSTKGKKTKDMMGRQLLTITSYKVDMSRYDQFKTEQA